MKNSAHKTPTCSLFDKPGLESIRQTCSVASCDNVITVKCYNFHVYSKWCITRNPFLLMEPFNTLAEQLDWFSFLYPLPNDDLAVSFNSSYLSCVYSSPSVCRSMWRSSLCHRISVHIWGMQIQSLGTSNRSMFLFPPSSLPDTLWLLSRTVRFDWLFNGQDWLLEYSTSKDAIRLMHCYLTCQLHVKSCWPSFADDHLLLL